MNEKRSNPEDIDLEKDIEYRAMLYAAEIVSQIPDSRDTLVSNYVLYDGLLRAAADSLDSTDASRYKYVKCLKVAEMLKDLLVRDVLHECGYFEGDTLQGWVKCP